MVKPISIVSKRKKGKKKLNEGKQELQEGIKHVPKQ